MTDLYNTDGATDHRLESLVVDILGQFD